MQPVRPGKGAIVCPRPPQTIPSHMPSSWGEHLVPWWWGQGPCFQHPDQVVVGMWGIIGIWIPAPATHEWVGVPSTPIHSPKKINKQSVVNKKRKNSFWKILYQKNGDGQWHYWASSPLRFFQWQGESRVSVSGKQVIEQSGLAVLFFSMRVNSHFFYKRLVKNCQKLPSVFFFNTDSDSRGTMTMYSNSLTCWRGGGARYPLFFLVPPFSGMLWKGSSIDFVWGAHAIFLFSA